MNPTITGLRGGLFLAEVDGNSAVLVVEHCDELESRAERLEVLAQRGDAEVVGVLELGDRALGDVEPSGELGLADGLGMAELVEADLFEGLGSLGGETLLGARPRLDLGSQFGELGSRHQINPSRFNSSRYSS